MKCVGKKEISRTIGGTIDKISSKVILKLASALALELVVTMLLIGLTAT